MNVSVQKCNEINNAIESVPLIENVTAIESVPLMENVTAIERIQKIRRNKEEKSKLLYKRRSHESL